jgi:acyl carrier protein
MNTLSESDKQALREILIETLETTADHLTPDASLREDFRPDSLTLAEIVMKLEDRFDVTIPDSEWEAVETIADLDETIAELLIATKHADTNRAGQP